MDQEKIFDKRRDMLRALIRDEFGSNKSQFASDMGLSPSYVSRMVTDGENRKNIGEKLARRIEAKAGKPRWWLDGGIAAEPATSAPATGTQRTDRIVEAFTKAGEHEREIVEKILAPFIKAPHTKRASRLRAR